MSDDARARARRLAVDSLANGDAVGWFEQLYAAAAGDPAAIQWADLRPNPNLTEWLDREGVVGAGRSCLVIGCGLGDDAEELARRGFAVTAFDVSPTAVAWCRKRFPASAVAYMVADVLSPPDEWSGGFDLVVEVYTLQVLPPVERAAALAKMARCVGPGGTLLVIARGREPEDDPGPMPWPLTRAELDATRSLGLREVRVEDYADPDDPAVRRFRAEYRAAAG